MENGILLGASLLIVLIVRRWLLKRTPSETASMASVMAAGIFINGALANFPALDRFGGLFSIVLFSAWFWIAISYISSYFQKTFRTRHLDSPIKIFAIGTWVAGSSVCAVSLARKMPELTALSVFVALVGLAVWLVYVVLCIASYIKIFRLRLFHQVHGVLLIFTVSTQSLVVIGATLMRDVLPGSLFAFMIGLGAVFYCL
ncbi:MAG TPA: hypothetical protein VF260_08270, partial [Bacilli bacterium]